MHKRPGRQIAFSFVLSSFSQYLELISSNHLPGFSASLILPCPHNCPRLVPPYKSFASGTFPLLNITHTHKHPQHIPSHLQTLLSFPIGRCIMKYLSLATIIAAASVVKAQIPTSIPACALGCATPVCTGGAADLACICLPTNIAAIGACVLTACTATSDLAAATALASICRISPPFPLVFPTQSD
jgi:hypothetical protein